MSRFSWSLARAGALFLISLAVYAERPPLTLDMVDHATGYMEWMLEVRFTAEQRQRYQQTLADMWRGNNQGTQDAIVTMAQVHEKLYQIPEAERAQKRAATQREFIRLLETANDDSSRWLMSIYRAAHSGGGVSAPAPQSQWQQPAGSSALLGRWSD